MKIFKIETVAAGILLTVQKQVGTAIQQASYLFNSPCEAKAFAASSFS